MVRRALSHKNYVLLTAWSYTNFSHKPEVPNWRNSPRGNSRFQAELGPQIGRLSNCWSVDLLSASAELIPISV